MDKYIKKINQHAIIQILFFVILLAADQLTKMLAVTQLKNNGAVTVIKGFADFQYLENTGAAFGILENSMLFFYIITIIIFAVIIAIWIRLRRNAKSYVTEHSGSAQFHAKTVFQASFLGYILSALAAGAIGNLIDRLINGYVVDFIRFTFFNFPIFNFADICVTVSVVILCIFFIFIYKEDPFFRIFGKKKHDA